MSSSSELYVDIPALREVPQRFYNLKKQAMEKVALIESSEKYLRFHLSGSEELCAEVRRIQNELETIGTTFEQMGQVLETICDLYAACESKEAEVAIQLKKKDDEPWYQSNTFKWVVGAVVVVGAGVAAAAVLTVGAPLLLTTFVVGAAIGAATGAVAGGIIGGIAAEKKGGTFADGFADGLLWGSIGGLLSGGVAATGAVVGAGTAVMAVTEGAIGAELYSANALYNGEEVTVEGTVLSFGAAVGAVVGGAVLAPAITGIKTAVVEAAEKSIAPGIGKTVSKEVTEETVGAVGKAGTKSTSEGGLGAPNYVKLSEELGTKIELEGYKIIDIEDAAKANADWADMGYNLPPVAENTKVYNVEAGDFDYARVFKEGVNNPKSPFIMRADDIKGLSAAEIAEKYALPQVPDSVVYPHIPTDTPLEISIVGPQESWGTIGGDAQYSIKDVLLDDDWFTDIHRLD